MKLLNKGKKSTLKGVLLLATISLGTVGFSAWVINGSTEENQNITFTVGSVTGKNLIISIDDSQTDGKVAFDSDGTEGNGLITGDGKYEDLTFKVVYTVTSVSGFSAVNPVKVTYTYSDYFEGIRGLATSNYINADCLNVTNITLNGTDTTLNEGVSVKYNGSSATVTHEWTFAWGSVFKGKNPCKVAVGDGEAYTNLITNLKNFETAAEAAMTGKTFNITITPSF